MSEKHTLGPWHVVHNGSFFEINVPWKDEDGIYQDNIDKYCPSVCSVFEKGNDGIRGENNVHIIAAAPSMYDALKSLLNKYIAIAESGDCGFCNPHEEREVKNAVDALKKARGE